LLKRFDEEDTMTSFLEHQAILDNTNDEVFIKVEESAMETDED
jgi:hypothetical protein